MLEEIQKYVNSFFNGLEININSLEISLDKNEICNIKLNSDDSSLLIGKHGNTIDAIQRILGLNINGLFGKKIKLEINNYYTNNDTKLFLKVDSIIDILRNTKTQYNMGKLSAYDRKKIHGYVSKNYFDIISKSKGEGENRQLFLIYKKEIKVKSKLTIDIDGVNI